MSGAYGETLKIAPPRSLGLTSAAETFKMRKNLCENQVIVLKLLTQIGIVFGICWLSQCIEQALPFTMPASIIGMVLLLALLGLRIVKTEHIQEKSDFLLANLPFFFVPSVVSIMKYTEVLRSNLLALIVVCVVSMVATFAATVLAVRLTIRLMNGGKKK